MLLGHTTTKYQRAAQQAAKDARRTIHDTPLFDLGLLTLSELRALMGLSQTQLSTALAENTGVTWSQGQIARVENGTRNMTNELFAAVNRLIKNRTDACSSDRTSNSSGSRTRLPKAAGL